MRLLLATAMLIGAAALSGCVRAKSARADGVVPPATPPNVLRLAVETDIRTLDPAVSTDWDSQPLVRLLYQGLLDYDDETRLVPWLARELPEASPDATTFTFRLRPGMRFSNGREVTAEDCVYALERSLDPATKSWGDGFLRGIAGAREYNQARARDASLPPGANGLRPREAEPRHVEGLRALDRYTL